jgi:hypothetical protein
VWSWHVDEIERRWPAASEAVIQAYEEDEKLLDDSLDTPGVDYVAVLLAHVPADVLAAAPAELPVLLRPIIEGLGVTVTSWSTAPAAALPTDALPDATERALQRGLGPLAAPPSRTPPVEHNGTGDYPCTECGHRGTGQVLGCTCHGCDDSSRPPA